MNEAHKESLELLDIVHKICRENNLCYTLTADTLIAYANGMDFTDCNPVIYLAIIYKDYQRLFMLLKNFCSENKGYSIHDYRNTAQFDTFDCWFVKESKIHFEEEKRGDAFYYGTRLVITPLFFVGDEEKEWNRAYIIFRDTTASLNVRAVLKGKPLRSYIRLTPKRRLSRHYIKLRGKYTIESCIEIYGDRESGKYVIYPHVIGRNPQDANSLPWIVSEKSQYVYGGIWQDVEETVFCDHKCLIVRETEKIVNCFPDHMIEAVLNKEKSQLALRGNTYLWRIQQIQLELLLEFDRICRKYALKYNISFGTLLGAVRHKGFIPWDDDIDVTMPVEDFDRLDDIMREELDPKKYYFRCPANEKNNHLIFKHLERRDTVYTKPGRQKLTQQIGVFIDIFPMYPSAHFRMVDWIHAKICRHWRTALWATIGADSVQDEKKKKYYKKISALGNKVCYEKFVRAAKFFHNDKYLKFWIAQDRNPYKTPLVRMSNYVDTVELSFEGHTFMAPRDYENVLDYCFGNDWRKYPSTRGRRPAHNAITEIGDLYKEESEGRQ
ncbi:MAG: LicD family protein [bacterium]|nr:LicD family protein [bacterium]